MSIGVAAHRRHFSLQGGGTVSLAGVPDLIYAPGQAASYYINNGATSTTDSSHQKKHNAGWIDLLPRWIEAPAVAADYEIRATFTQVTPMSTNADSNVWKDLASGSYYWTVPDDPLSTYVQEITLDIRHKVNMTIDATKTFTLQVDTN